MCAQHAFRPEEGTRSAGTGAPKGCELFRCLSVSCWNHTGLITIAHSTYTVG